MDETTLTPICPLCQGNELQLLYPSTLPAARESVGARFRCTSNSYGIHDDILRCRTCGLVFARPSYSEKELVAQYAGIVDPMYEAERKGRVLTFRRNLQPIRRLLGQGSWRFLDVGCHIGLLVEQAELLGWESWGVEPSRWASEQAVRRGLRVLPTTVAGAAFAEHYFDIVTLWDVIEHLANPVEELMHIHRILRPDGLLVIHTINIESLFARTLGPRWPWLMEMHRYYFSPRTLGLLLHKTGFTQFETINQGRYLRLGYLMTRLVPYLPLLSSILGRVVARLHLAALPVPVNLGDLFTSFSRRNPAEALQEGT